MAAHVLHSLYLQNECVCVRKTDGDISMVSFQYSRENKGLEICLSQNASYKLLQTYQSASNFESIYRNRFYFAHDDQNQWLPNFSSAWST